MKNFYLFLIFLLVFLLSYFIKTFDDEVLLDYEGIIKLKVVERIKYPFTSISVSGISIHSSLKVSRVEIKTEKKSIHFLVYLSPTKEGSAGNFSEHLNIPKNVDIVYFGKSKKIIWERDKEVSKLKNS